MNLENTVIQEAWCDQRSSWGHSPAHNQSCCLLREELKFKVPAVHPARRELTKNTSAGREGGRLPRNPSTESRQGGCA